MVNVLQRQIEQAHDPDCVVAMPGVPVTISRNTQAGTYSSLGFRYFDRQAG